MLDLLAGGGRAVVAARADLDVEDLVREVRRELGGLALGGAGRSASEDEVLAAYGQLAAYERAGPLRAVGGRIALRLVSGGPVGLPGGGPKKQPHNWTAPRPPGITRPGERGPRASGQDVEGFAAEAWAAGVRNVKIRDRSPQRRLDSRPERGQEGGRGSRTRRSKRPRNF